MLLHHRRSVAIGGKRQKDNAVVSKAWSTALGDELYTTNELSSEFGVTTRTLRFYESEGLLAPLRQGRNRHFTQRDRVRLKLILRGKRLGFALCEIAEIISLYDAEPGEAGQLGLLIRKIGERRLELMSKQADIDTALQELELVEQRSRKRLDELTGGKS